MMRIVFDTNIVVSAMLSPSGTAADALRLALNRHVQLCASEVMFEEFEEALRRPKFRRPPQVVSAVMRADVERLSIATESCKTMIASLISQHVS